VITSDTNECLFCKKPIAAGVKKCPFCDKWLDEARLDCIILDHANLADAWRIDLRITGRSLHGELLTRAILRKVKVAAYMINADLTKAKLQGADLREVLDLWRVGSLAGARYDNETKWPQGFDPRDRGAIRADEDGSPL
jgi:hypothetical protein